MPENQKKILFTYTEYTAASTVTLMRRLLAMFPADRFETHLLKLDGNRPDVKFQDFITPIKRSLYLHFNFDCIGFAFQSFGESPYYNTLWTPCVTYLTAPAAGFDRLLRQEWNLNITVLCEKEKEADYIRARYPDISDVRVVTNPAVSLEPLYETLLSIANRYET